MHELLICSQDYEDFHHMININVIDFQIYEYDTKANCKEKNPSSKTINKIIILYT